MKIVLFGPPGVGKSTLAAVFNSHFAFQVYDADDDLTEAEKQIIQANLWSDEHRIGLMDRIANKIELYEKGGDKNLVLVEALTKQWMRDYLTERFTKLKFVLVKSKLSKAASYNLISKRHREGHPVSLEAYRRFHKEFDPPLPPYWVLENTFDNEVVNQISRLLEVLNMTEN